MKLVIAYLYYDLLNLYGENGNIKILKKQLEELGITAKVKFLSIEDSLNFDDYDLVYIGAGTENNQVLALKHLIKYKKDIKSNIEKGKIFIVTGNAIELFGKTIEESKKTKALNIFSYETKHEIFSMADEALFKDNRNGNLFIGFQNQIGTIKNNTTPWFSVLKGIGSYPNSLEEGIQYKNFYGTYLIGPVLVRNPHFLEEIIDRIVKNKNLDVKFSKKTIKLEKEAYNNYLQNFYQDFLTKSE